MKRDNIQKAVLLNEVIIRHESDVLYLLSFLNDEYQDKDAVIEFRSVDIGNFVFEINKDLIRRTVIYITKDLQEKIKELEKQIESL
jgi:hypothetical protein